MQISNVCILSFLAFGRLQPTQKKTLKTLNFFGLHFQEKEGGSYGWVGAGVGMRGSPLVWRHTCVIADFIKVFLSFYWDIWKQSNK